MLYMVSNETTFAQSGFANVFFDDAGSVISNAVAPTSDNGVIIVGQKDYGGLFMKIDSSGAIEWKKSFQLMDTYSQGAFSSLISTSDSQYIAAGAFYTSDTAGNTLSILKFNGSGDTIWTNAIGFGSYITLTSVKETFDNGLVAAGYTMNNDAPQNEMFICKLNSAGHLEWSRKISDGTDMLMANVIQQTHDSGFIVGGVAQQLSSYQAQAIVMKLNANGEFSWAKSYTINQVQKLSVNDIVLTDDGFLTGMNKSLEWFMADVVIAKSDFSGNIQWAKNYSSSAWMSQFFGPGIKIHPLSDGNFEVVSGQVYKMDAQGNIVWVSDPFLATTDAAECTDKGFMIVGNGPLMGVKEPQHHSAHIGIIKTNPMGLNANECLSEGYTQYLNDTLLSTDVTFQFTENGMMKPFQAVISTPLINTQPGCVSFFGGLEDGIPNDGFRIYPNPSNDLIHIVSNTKESIQRLEIFDIHGKLALSIDKPDISTTAIDVKSLQNGVYFVRLATSHHSFSQKLIITH